MKQFAIAINSEKEYNRVKEYAEKWGYNKAFDREFDPQYKLVFFKENKYNICHGVGSETVILPNWRKAIRKHSPLKLENIFVRIDTVERVKEVWDIVRESGVNIGNRTRDVFNEKADKLNYIYICYDKSEKHFDLFNKKHLSENSITEITPKQLAQMLGVKREKPIVHESVITEVQIINSKVVSLQKENANLRSWVEDLDREFNKRIDRLAKNYKITESDKLSTKEELKAVNNKLRKRMYDLEQEVSKSKDSSEFYNNPTITLKADCVIPKIAIRVENEQEFNNLMEIYEVLGWKWNSLRSPVRPASNLSFPNHVLFKNYFTHTTEPEDCGYTVIPFSQIKNLV